MPDDGQGALDLYIKPPLAQRATFSAANEGAETTRCSLFTSAR
jgi:hypothetical protein